MDKEQLVPEQSDPVCFSSLSNEAVAMTETTSHKVRTKLRNIVVDSSRCHSFIVGPWTRDLTTWKLIAHFTTLLELKRTLGK
jgi:hypothetical protein